MLVLRATRPPRYRSMRWASALDVVKKLTQSAQTGAKELPSGAMLHNAREGSVLKERTLSNLPTSDEIWAGIGGHFDSLGQILAEFIDNSVANIIAVDSPTRNVGVTLIETNDAVVVQVEDTGGGIVDLDNAFTLGGKAGCQSPLNEHGFGMKHALASANPQNDTWVVFTRTTDSANAGTYEAIRAPYVLDGQRVQTLDIAEEVWPGIYNGTGTLIRFECSRDLFDTLGARIPGPNPGFDGMVGYLVEFLGYVYSGLILASEVLLQVTAVGLDGQSRIHRVSAVTPDWAQFYSLGQG